MRGGKEGWEEGEEEREGGTKGRRREGREGGRKGERGVQGEEGGRKGEREERGISPLFNFLISPTIAHPNHFTVQLSRTGAKEPNRFFSTHTLPVVFRTS